MGALAEILASGSHFEVGLGIGRRFASRIARSLASYPFLHQRLLAFHHSADGQERYRRLLEFNKSVFPDYCTELEGIAQGSGQPFAHLFLVNLRGEYREYLAGLDRGCSDCALLTEEAALLGHNEDGAPSFKEYIYLVRANITGKPAFVALSYPGFLCGNAFGFNEEGIVFSCDNVRPVESRVGAGRHFLARSLFEARSLDDAISRTTVSPRATGFSYTLGSIRERRIVHVEVSPRTHRVTEVEGSYFHANHYQELKGVPQRVGPSSLARVARAKGIAEVQTIRDAAGILEVLGDEHDPDYPLFRSGSPPDGGATLCTALFDLDARRLCIYTSHPIREPDQHVEILM